MTDAKRLLAMIDEMAAPSQVERGKTYYHGTSSETAAISILQTGLKTPDLTDRKGFQKPREGKVYLTPSLGYAVIYALGGMLAGTDVPDSFIKREGRYGYVFVVKGSQLSDIEPDEDSVGEILTAYLDYEQQFDQYKYLKRGHSPEEIRRVLKCFVNLSPVEFEKRGGEPRYDPRYFDKPDESYGPNSEYTYRWRPKAPWLLYLAQNRVAASRLNQVRQGDCTYQSSVGKQLIPKMSDSQKLQLIQMGGTHVAHHGNIMPVEAWKFDKLKSKELTGSNFFELAERVL